MHNTATHSVNQPSSFASFVEKVEGWRIPPLPSDDEVASHASTDSLCQRRRAIKRWWGSASKSIISTLDAKVRRMWELHDEGWTMRAIARECGWKSAGSVAYYLAKPRPPEQPDRFCSMPGKESPRKALLKKEDCTLLLQRGREVGKFAVTPSESALDVTENLLVETLGVTRQAAARWLGRDIVWKQQDRSAGSSHPGNTESRFSESPAFLSALAANKRNRVRIPEEG